MCLREHRNKDTTVPNTTNLEEIVVDFGAHYIVGAIALLMFVSGLNAVSVYGWSNYEVPDDLNTGPYVDRLVYKVIDNQDQRIVAIQAGEIEMDTTFLGRRYLDSLGFEDPDISIFSALRNGYGHITINCAKYPLNISAFRRAFAYAFDKTRVTAEIMDGFSQEHDSLVPYVSGWCIEDDMPYHYYTAQVATGAAMLDDAGFTIDPDTGFRLTPDGTAFDVVIEYASSSPEIAGGTAQIGVDALRALNVNAKTQAADFNEYITRCGCHNVYDMVFYSVDFYGNDVDWLAYEYWSDYADVPYQNPTNFRNATYDSWRNQLLHGTTYEEVHEAATQMQLILQYNVPRLVVYENTYMQAYRNDQFIGHVPDLVRYITGPWTMRNIRKANGDIGGIVTIAIPSAINTLNPFMGYSDVWIDGLDSLYSSLYRLDPMQHPIGDLATNCTLETHDDNQAIPAGHTRFTISMIQNATWTDGQPLTAEDVANTFSYILESGNFGNPLANQLSDLYAVYTPGPYQVVFEFISESYWHFNNFAYVKILPKHIFGEQKEIAFDEWNNWNPVFNHQDPLITCGPFVFTDYEDGENYTLSKNPNYQWLPDKSIVEEPTTSSPEDPLVVDAPLVSATTIAISIASGEIILAVSVMAYRDYQRIKRQMKLAEEEENRDWFAEIFGN
ncbi:MAG: ABC transporter substrate-binding protein [Promethearchaeota archaeon]